jgi:hypothetical protein
MSNKTGAFGLKPVRRIDGSPWNGGLVRCYISASYAVALYKGDPVIFDTALADKDLTARCPTIILSSGADQVLCRGVIVSFEPLATDLTKLYNPASTERYALVCMDPQVVYQIRDDGAGTPSKVFPGQNATMTASGGSTVTGRSGYVLDTSTPTTTQTYPLHILGLAPIEDNELDDYAIWEVLLNTPENAAGRVLGVTAS